MVEEFFKEIVEVGIRVQGPEGIGKSFSLVNLVLYLKSTGKIHLVTCRSGLWQMDEPVLVYEMICHSIGMDLSDLGMEWNGIWKPTMTPSHTTLRVFVEKISNLLEARGIKWVFCISTKSIVCLTERRTCL